MIKAWGHQLGNKCLAGLLKSGTIPRAHLLSLPLTYWVFRSDKNWTSSGRRDPMQSLHLYTLAPSSMWTLGRLSRGWQTSTRRVNQEYPLLSTDGQYKDVPTPIIQSQASSPDSCSTHLTKSFTIAQKSTETTSGHLSFQAKQTNKGPTHSSAHWECLPHHSPKATLEWGSSVTVHFNPCQ